MSKKDYSELSKEQLIELVEKLESKKKYGLVWDEERVPEQVVLDCKENLPVLTEVKDREIHTSDDEPTHILIEGDNYHALSVLNYTHQGKIDFIYIDPPYNTGNKSWKYNNRFVDEEDPFRHSKWISFMYKRLLLAKHLLSEEGVICITIDNYELHNIRHIMEEVFTDKEIITTIIQHNFRGRAKNNFALTHEYALWAVTKGQDVITKQVEVSADIKRNLRRTGQGSRRHESPTLFYGIEVNKKTFEIISYTEPIPEGNDLPQSSNPETEYVFPIDSNNLDRRWYYGSTTMFEEAQRGNVWAKMLKGKLEIHYFKPGKPKRRKSVWTGSKYDSSTHGSELLTEIIGENDFPYPKSIFAVMESIVSATSKKDAIILDFFAGSGTTGHAVLNLNERDDGTRKFILCANNENNICDEITFPRIRNVIQGYDFSGKSKELLLSVKLNLASLKKIDETFEDIKSISEQNDFTKTFDNILKKIEKTHLNIYGEKIIDDRKDGLGNNLKFFRTSFVKSGENKDQLRIDITKRCTEMLCLKEGIYKLKKETADWKIFEEKNKYLAVYYDFPHASLDELRDEMNDLEGEKVLYCFTVDPNGLNKEDFSDWENIRLEPIPQKILDVYKDIFQN